MAKLIDFETARNATYEEVFWTESEQASVRNFLAKLPKVDAAGVVHGHWEIRPDPYRYLYQKYACSVCGGWRHNLAFEHENMNYCPNCGAKMDGGKENEQF